MAHYKWLAEMMIPIVYRLKPKTRLINLTRAVHLTYYVRRTR